MEINKLLGVGIKTSQILNQRGIFTIKDLLFLLPKRYESFKEDSLLLAVDKTNITTTGIVVDTPKVIDHRGTLKSLQFKILVEHETYLVIAYRREYLKDTLKENMIVQVKGRFEKKKKRITASHVLLNPIKAELKPVYDIEGLYDTNVSKIIKAIFTNHKARVVEILPEKLLKKNNLIDRYDMIYYLHFPQSFHNLAKAQKRFKYEEALFFQLKIMREKLISQNINKIPKVYNLDLVKEFIKNIPYELTNDQKKAVNDIFSDFKKPYPVKRLIQGDVGSGKTVVVAISIYGAKTAGFQSAIMAPTEVLAQQHYELFKSNYPNLKSVLLIGSTKNKEKVKEKIKNHEYDLIIGTHALLTEDTVFANLGFVVIDEQHRFGVVARETLEEKGNADICYLTATPIPRTLAIVLFGDMEISTIYEKPSGRLPVITKYFTLNQEASVFEHVKKELKKGNQAYFVAPSIESDFRGESVVSLSLRVKKNFDTPIFILHGKLSGQEKQEIMENFSKTKGAILISTTVIEVGLDIKGATMMVIFGGNYFGLSQLHQLRGRVGRSDMQSYCYVISEDIDVKRLQLFEKTLDGFILSEYDLEHRGPGEFLGIKQSGMIDFRYANIASDFELFVKAKEDALWLLKNKDGYNYFLRQTKRSMDL